MATDHHTDHHHHEAAPVTETHAIRRLSWRAIIAGALAAMAIQLLFTVLGLAIGLNVAQDGTGQSLAIGAGIWWVVTGTISLFFGGWIAGHASRAVDSRDAMLQGFIQWTVVTAVSALLVTSALGSVLGGTFSLVGTMGQTAGSTAQAVVPDNVDLSGQPLQSLAGQIPWQEVERDVEQVIEAYAPQAVEQRGGEQTVDLAVLARTWLTADQAERSQRRQELVQALRQQTGLSQAEADRAANEIQQAYQQAAQAVGQAWQQTQETAVQAAQATAEVSADAAWWTFFSLLLGAIMATVGGAIGGRTGGPLFSRRTLLRPVTA